MRAGSKDYFFHYDPLGSVVNLTGSTGAAMWTYTYEPYGALRTETKNNNQAPITFLKFAGEYFDPTGLYHLRARQYDPSIGRFTTLDPLPNPTTDPYVSAYAYVNDRPTVLTDPSGLRPNCTSLWCFVKSIPDTIACGTRHPLHTAGVVASWTVAVGFAYGGWRLGAAIASSKAPGLLAELSHPAHVAMPVALKWLVAAGSGGLAYEQSKELARICQAG